VRERERNEREREKKHVTACVHVCVFGEGECVHAYVHFRAGFYVTRIPNTLRNRNAEHHETVECGRGRLNRALLIMAVNNWVTAPDCVKCPRHHSPEQEYLHNSPRHSQRQGP
jgi:hypothetical protein